MTALEFATGKLNLYDLEYSQAYTGGMPKETLKYVSWTYYGERTVSYSRLYEARGADAPCDKVVRIPADVATAVGRYVILEDGEQYRIDAVSTIIVASNVRAKELTLARLEDRYDVSTGQTV